MRQSATPWASRARRFIPLCTTALVLGACTKSGDGAGSGKDTGSVATTYQASSKADDGKPGTRQCRDEPSTDGPTPQPISTGQFEGRLEKTIDQYRQDPNSFYSLVRGKRWVGWVHRRVCKGHVACKNKAPVGCMDIEAIHDAHRVSPGRSALGNGVIIGRVINKGLYTDSATQFPSDFAQTAPSTSFYWTEYYWILVPPQEAGTGQKDGFASLEILALRFDQSSGHVSSLDVFSPVQIQKPGKFFVCDDTHPQPTQAVADFQPCPHRGNDLAHTMWQPTDATLEAGAWFSCLDGCCSAQVPPFFEFRSAKAVQRDAAA